MLTIYYYPKCGTCRKALKWLKDAQIDFSQIDIAVHPPARETLMELQQKSGLPLKKWFNTSGRRYRELRIKDRMKAAPESDWLDWLASDGMLIKRPIVTDGVHVTVGFKDEVFREVWGRLSSKKEQS